MAGVEIVEGIVLSVPDVVGSILKIWGSCTDRMLVEAVETRLVDDVEDSLLRMGDRQGRVAGHGLSISLYRDHRAEVDTLLRVASRMPRHRELGGDGLHLMGYLGCECYLAVDIAAEPDGNQFVGVRGEVFSLNLLSVAQVTILDDAAVKAEATVVVTDSPEPEILDMQCTQRLEVL